MAITLKDYGDKDRHFVLEDPAGKWTVVRGRLQRPTCGYATLVRQRFGLADPVFVAVFTDRRTVLLRVGARLFDLRDSRTLFRDRLAGILTKRFVVLGEGRELASVTYGYLSVDRDPFDSDSIFDYLVRMFTDKTRLDRTVFVWTAAGEGRKLDDPAFLAEVEARFPSSAE